MAFFTHEFEAELRLHQIGNASRKVAYKVVFLPAAVARDLPFDKFPRLRVDAEIADIPVNGAWQPTGDGSHYLMVPKAVFTETDCAIGDTVDVRFKIAEQNEVDVPGPLEEALAADAGLKTKWDALTPGKQRAFCHRVASAKTSPTIAKRVAEVIHMVENGLSYGKGGSVKSAKK